MRCVIHIGPPKTGTTTIQVFLKINRIALCETGIYVPETKSANQRELRLAAASRVRRPKRSLASWNISDTASLEALRPTFRSSAEKWLQEAARTNCGTFLTSSEGYASMTRDDIQRLHAFLAPYCDANFTIVALLRRQDLHANSRAKNLAKYDESAKRRFRGINYQQLLDRWAEVFGEAAVRPVVFPDSTPNRERIDLLEAFVRAAALPLEDLSRFEKPERRNTAWDYRAMAIIEEINQILPPLQDGAVPPARQLIERVLGKAWPEPQPYRMPLRRAQRLCEHHAESNAAVARRWFGREQLFHDDFSMYEAAAPQEVTVRDYASVIVQLAQAATKGKDQPRRRRRRQREAAAAETPAAAG